MTRQFGQIPLSGGLVTGLCPREESFNTENMGQEATHGGHSEQNALSVLLGKESKNSTLSRRCFLLAPPGLFGFLTPHLTSNNVRTFPIPKKTRHHLFNLLLFLLDHLQPLHHRPHHQPRPQPHLPLPSNVFQHLNSTPDRQHGLLPIMPFPRGRHVPASRCHPPPHRP